ncbi:MAG: lysylphosphatidylglycerol synthase transmembrane domain-containing protein [Chloroflexota bacterium]
MLNLRQRWLSNWLSTALKLLPGTLLLILLVSQTSGDKLNAAFSNFSAPYAMLACGFLICANVNRAIRFWVLARKQMPLVEAYRLTTTYNLITALVPGGLGELYLPYAVERDYKMPYAKGLSLLAITRLIDLIAVAVLLVIGTFGLAYSSPQLWILAPIGIVLLLVLLAALYNIDHVMQFVEHQTRRIPLLVPLTRFLGKFTLAFRQLRAEAVGSVRMTVIGTTILLWLFAWGNVTMMLYTLGLPLNLTQVALGMGIIFSTGVLPLSGLANFGIRDAGWAFVLILTLGLAREQAVAAAFAVHLVTLLCVFVVWVSGHMGHWLLHVPPPLANESESR